MKRTYAWIIVCLALGLIGYLVSLEGCVKVYPGTADAYPSWRWIGILHPSQQSCPAAAGWEGRQLFPLDRLSNDARETARRLGLDRYCVYESKTESRLPRATRNLLLQERRTPMALVLSGDDLESMTWEPFQQTFLSHTGQMAGPAALAGAPRVRLAIVDTQATGTDVPTRPDSGRSLHGYTLARIARRLACGDLNAPSDPGSCAAWITTRLALPYPDFDRDNLTEPDPRGGFVGTIDGLAAAIVQEITDWEGHRTPGEHLVINLSVGWNGKKFGGLAGGRSQMPGDVGAMYDALQFAAQRGVLVIAAAGNRGGGPDLADLHQPLLPAGWEARRAEMSEDRPLIYAVGGVRAGDVPLVNARLDSTPPRVAYADHAVVEDADGQPTATLTGTSVASVVVATTAAVLWHYNSGLTAGQLMKLLDANGDELEINRPADFPLAGTTDPPPVRRISLKGVLAKACPLCPAAVATVSPSPLAPEVATFAATFSLDARSLNMTLSGASPCRAGTIRYQSSNVPSFPCPFDKLSSLPDQPWTSPQPGRDPCPSCEMAAAAESSVVLTAFPASGATAKTFTLRIEIPSSFTSCVEATNLEVYSVDASFENRPLFSYALGHRLCPGQSLKVSNISLDGAEAAALNFVRAAEEGFPQMSFQSAIYVEH